MTILEFRIFFDTLPDEEQNTEDDYRPDKISFAKECRISLAFLRRMAIGKMSFNEATINKLLPVMRKYGFQG